MKRIKTTKRTGTLARSAVSICVSFLYLNVTVKSQGVRFLSIQDEKQAVEQFELRTHSTFSVYKKDKGFGEKSQLTFSLIVTVQYRISNKIF